MKTVKSHFQDRTVSWVRVVNGVDEYVTESMPTAKEGNTASGKPIAEARPRQKPALMLTSISIPVLERIRIDIETQRFTRSRVFRSVKSRHPIATTWSNSPSRCWRCIPVKGHHRRVQEEEGGWCFAIATWRMDIKCGKRRRSKEKVSILLES